MRNLGLTGALSDVGFLICDRDSKFVAALGDIRAVLVDEPLPDPLGVHRRTVRAALESPLPPVRRAPVGRPAPKLGAYDAPPTPAATAPRGRDHA